MIHYFFENIDEFKIEKSITEGLKNLIISEGKKLGEVQYIFCDDDYLLKVNQDYLQHDYYTDIITFDYVKGKMINGDIFISLPRILDNAKTLSTKYEDELKRVLTHGLLHLCGYKDKTDEEKLIMRNKEDFYINLINKND